MQKKVRIIILIVALSCLIKQYAMAQILFSDGATVYISSGGVMFANGGVELTQTTSFTNEGELTATKNSTFPSAGDFMLNTAASASGNGSYKVEQDWVNNALFTANNSTVELYGNTAQNITSSNNTVTTFNNLTLTGAGVGNDRKKILLNVNAIVGTNGILTINDRELATETNTFFILNPNVTSVTNTTTAGAEGFVSSLSPGYFSRVTASANTYLFPTGSSVGITRYRPLEIAPTSALQNVYHARLNNNDATINTYDRSSLANEVCATNDLYYHSIARVAGNALVDVKFHYINGLDGLWNNLAHWNTASAKWNDLGTVNNANSGIFSTITKTAWNFPDADHPYILSTTRPLPPNLNCPKFCENTTDVYFTASGSTTGYQWSFPNPATVNYGQGTNLVSVDWSTGNGYVYVFALGTAGCNSLPDSCMPVVSPIPVANFSNDASNSFGNAYAFQDLSTSPAQWNWNFGDGDFSTEQSPLHVYGNAGTYVVTLTIENEAGCTSKATSSVTIEGEEVFIPNTFTPNTDDLNDEFLPVLRTAKSFSMSIFNRWGELIFSSENMDHGWNGTYKGELCQNDVYVYHLRVTPHFGPEKTIIGHVTLLK